MIDVANEHELKDEEICGFEEESRVFFRCLYGENFAHASSRLDPVKLENDAINENG